MSFLNVLSQIDTDKLESEAKDKFLSRKDALGKMSNFSKKLALSALPLGALAAFSTPAKAQSTGDIVDVLNFALTLEYLEAEYYQMGLDSGIVDSYAKGRPSIAAHAPTFQEISNNENAHVTFLQDTINELGGEPEAKPEFDFTASGSFAPFENGETFLLLAQAFEDTGVRAYKGQAGNVQGSDVVLTAALRIHSVEARHASAVRKLRAQQGWIPFDQPEAPDAIAAVYAAGDLGEPHPSEANVTHAGVNVTQQSNISEEAITEAWDEPLGREDVLAIVAPFIVSN